MLLTVSEAEVRRVIRGRQPEVGYVLAANCPGALEERIFLAIGYCAAAELRVVC